MKLDKTEAVIARLESERDELVQKNTLFERSVADAERRVREAENRGEDANAALSDHLARSGKESAEVELLRAKVAGLAGTVDMSVVDELRSRLRTAEARGDSEASRAARIDGENNALRLRLEQLSQDIQAVREQSRGGGVGSLQR